MVKDGERKWNVNFDVLRILACFLVVLAHASSEQIDVMSVHSSDWMIAHLYNSVGHTGTILFLFISGALLLSKDYKFDLLKGREKRTGRIWIGAALTVTGMLCGLAGDYTASLQRGVNVISCNDLFSVSMCMSAVGLFLMINTLTLTPGIQAKKLLMECSRLCFGIYMLHPIIWGRVINIECFMGLPIILRIPVRAVLVFVICLLIIWILGRIPVVRQWVIYANKPYSAKKAQP